MHAIRGLAPILILAVAAAGTPPSSRSEKPDADGTLVWHDEFDGASLDPSKWRHRGLGRRRDAVNVKDAVRLDGKGHLVITTRRVGDRYETGMIGTQGTFERAFGYWECRVRLQKAVGHWSAFWLQSPRFGRKVGDVEASGTEIDIFEYLRKRGDVVQHTLHWDGYGKHHQSAGKKVEVPGFGDGWHTIGLEWTRDAYVFYVDGKETWRTTSGVSHTPENIIQSLEVGKWAGDIADADLPDSVLFDYVRVYASRPRAGR